MHRGMHSDGRGRPSLPDQSRKSSPMGTAHFNVRAPNVALRLSPRSTLCTLLLVASAAALTAAERAPDGRKIFAQKCASCHGAKGQGVKDKYADPLVGDWSIAKLARYVAANMPEDKPETLSP